MIDLNVMCFYKYGSILIASACDIQQIYVQQYQQYLNSFLYSLDFRTDSLFEIHDGRISISSKFRNASLNL